MSTCLINERERIFGSALVAKNINDVLKRKEYAPFLKEATAIIQAAERCKMYCPGIFIESDVMCIFYTNDDRYVKFFISKTEIYYKVGILNVEDNFYNYSSKTKMMSLSDYLYKE